MGIHVRLAVYALFLLSGCAALVYEVVWIRQLALLFGGTTYAITTVIVSFMAGLGLGSYLGGRWGGWVRRPGRAYAGLEIAIGLYTLLVPVLMGTAEPFYRGLYPHVVDNPWLLSTVRFCISALILIVPTTLMGATLPLLVTYVMGDGRLLGRSTGLLYGVNTLGAMLGALLAGFLLIPFFGMSLTTQIAAGTNLLVGLVGWRFLSGERSTAPERLAREKGGRDPTVAVSALDLPPASGAILTVAFVSGLAAMIYQISWTRALIMSVGSSTYSFTCILAAFILGLGLGSLAAVPWIDRFRRPVLLLAMLEFGIGLTAVLIVPIHGRVPSLVRQLVISYHEEYDKLLTLTFSLIIAVTLVPTLLMGMAFPLMTRLVGMSRLNAATAVGRVYVVNTVGAIVGALLAGFVLIRSEVLGTQYSIVAAALASGLAGACVLLWAPPAGWSGMRARAAVGVGLFSIACAGFSFSKWDKELLTSGPYYRIDDASQERHILFFREDVDITVSVARAAGNKDRLSLVVNGKTDASTDVRDVRTQLLLGHLPAMLDRGAKRACIIGLGSGMTLSAIARHPSYERLDCIEISDAVIEAASFFAPYNDNILFSDPRVRLFRADGRNHLLLTDQCYDLIVSEPSNPWIAGVANLFTREFFEICKRRITPDGRVAIWMHSYAMSRDDFRMVVRTLCEVFEDVSLWQIMDTDYCLVAGNTPSPMSASEMMARYAQPAVRADLYHAGIRDLAGILGTFVDGGKRLREWAAGAAVHTDDLPSLEFSAPRFLYRNEALAIGFDLGALQGSPCDEVLVCEPTDPVVVQLQDRVATVIDARRAGREAPVLWGENAYAQAAEMLMGGYECDPGNMCLYDALRQVRTLRGNWVRSSADSEAFRQFEERMDRLPAPAVVFPRGGAPSEVADALRSMADPYLRRQLWYPAVFYLEQAYSLAPNNGRIAGQLALVLLKSKRRDWAQSLLDDFLTRLPEDGWANYAAGHLAVSLNLSDKAVSRFEQALKSGEVNSGLLVNDPSLAPLMALDGFVKLLSQYPP
ncbi:MAG TPA: fused MFS/spermidine synthase [Phycisphaerae bacterium]|nr:fused MFS/spermidine synthase [Phycisphaerae bacterium]